MAVYLTVFIIHATIKKVKFSFAICRPLLLYFFKSTVISKSHAYDYGRLYQISKGADETIVSSPFYSYLHINLHLRQLLPAYHQAERKGSPKEPSLQSSADRLWRWQALSPRSSALSHSSFNAPILLSFCVPYRMDAEAARKANKASVGDSQRLRYYATCLQG